MDYSPIMQIKQATSHLLGVRYTPSSCTILYVHKQN